MEDAGLTVRVDAVGNTYGRWQGSDSSAGKTPLLDTSSLWPLCQRAQACQQSMPYYSPMNVKLC